MAIVSFFPVTEDVLAVGALTCSSKERKALAAKSPNWTCRECGKSNREIADEIMQPMTEKAAEAELRAAGDGPLASQLSLESEAQKKKRLGN